jgi:hypothetical protein
MPPAGTQKGDVYSFGIILYAIHSRQGPFGFTCMNAEEILRRVMTHQPPIPPFRCVFFVATVKFGDFCGRAQSFVL